MNRTTTALIGLGVGLALARVLRGVPERVFPYPDAEARLLVPGAAPGSLGAIPRGLFGTSCDPELVHVTTKGTLSSTICTSPAEKDVFMRETERARSLQVALFVGLVASGAAVGYALGDRPSKKRTG